MKLAGIISTAVLSLTLGAAVPVYAQQEEHGQQEEKQAQQDEKKAQPDKSAQQEEKKAQQDEKKVQQEKPSQQEEKKAQHDEKKQQQEKPTAQHEQQAQHADNHRIPDDRFRANFGREHVFVINRPVIIEGQPRFQYGGYWFGFSQPWPGGWLYTDNVYVDFVDGGYYLYNPFHPGIRVVIMVI